MRLTMNTATRLARVARIAIVLGCVACGTPAATCLAVEGSLLIDVRETRGLARSNCPVSVQLELPKPVPTDTRFRLSKNGEAVTAQFRPADEGMVSARWWLDFVARLAPHETQSFRLENGPDVEAGPVALDGHRLELHRDGYVITNGDSITWTVPRDLRGLLTSVEAPPLTYLRPTDLDGLTLIDRDSGAHQLGGGQVTSKVVREGPQAVALRYEGRIIIGDMPVPYQVDLIFPSNVSWVEVVCNLDDPRDLVERLQANVGLALDEPTDEAPTLVDFGAGTYVYVSLAAGQAATLSARPADEKRQRGWDVVRFSRPDYAPQRLAKSAAPEPAGMFQAAEGWLHVMDSRRCLALAVDRFGESSADEIGVMAAGNVNVFRRFPAAGAGDKKSLRFWMHFVGFPPQHTAATSPRMMMSPPEITVRPAD